MQTSQTAMLATTRTDVLAYPLADACAAIGCKRSFIYELIGAGKLDARKQGSRTVITAASLHAYVESLPFAEIGRGVQGHTPEAA